jgi:hypothetical protein
MKTRTRKQKIQPVVAEAVDPVAEMTAAEIEYETNAGYDNLAGGFVGDDVPVYAEAQDEVPVVDQPADEVIEIVPSDPEPAVEPTPVQYLAWDVSGREMTFPYLLQAKTYSDHLGGMTGVESDSGCWLNIRGEDGFFQWTEVDRGYYNNRKQEAIIAGLRERIAGLESTHRDVAVVSEERPARVRKPATESKPRPQGKGKSVAPWTVGDPVDADNPFGLSRCQFVQSLGRAGYSVAAATAAMTGLGIRELNAFSIKRQHSLGTQGGGIELSEGILELLKPYEGAEAAPARASRTRTVAVTAEYPNGIPAPVSVAF